MKHNPYIFISIFNIYTFILEYTPTKNTTKKILFINRFFTLLRFIQNDRGLWNGLFLSQSSQSIGEIISFLSSQRNIIDVLWSWLCCASFRMTGVYDAAYFTLLRFVQNDRALWNGLFLSQSSLSIGEMISFLSSLRNIIDVLWSTLFFLFTLLENLSLHKEILGFVALRWERQGSMKWLIFITKFTKYWWNDCVFEFSKEHHRCFMKYTVFSIYTFRKSFSS